jgi:hypothetical protein
MQHDVELVLVTSQLSPASRIQCGEPARCLNKRFGPPRFIGDNEETSWPTLELQEVLGLRECVARSIVSCYGYPRCSRIAASPLVTKLNVRRSECRQRRLQVMWLLHVKRITIMLIVSTYAVKIASIYLN